MKEVESIQISVEMSETVARRVIAQKQEDIAIAESQLWNLASPQDRKKYSREAWIAAVLQQSGLSGKEISQFQIKTRGYLISAPKILWDQIDGPENMSHATAAALYVQCKVIVREERVPIDLAAKRLLDEYMKLPVFHTPDGKTFRRATGATKMQQAPDEKNREKDVPPLEEATGRGWWARLREVISHIADEKIPVEADEVTRRELYEWLDREITTVIRQFTTIASNAGTKTVEIARKQVLSACHTLHMDPPPPGGSIDVNLVKRQKRKLAAHYHPDANKGDESMSALYDAVIQAATTLETYAKQNKKPNGDLA